MEASLAADVASIGSNDELAGQRSLSAEEVRLISAIGFMSAKAGCAVPALRIFEAMVVLRTGQAFPFIGMAIAYLAIGMAEEAAYVLRERAISSCAESDELGLWLSLALQQAGKRAAAQKELKSATQGMAAEVLPSLACLLSALLGARPEAPTWPTPAPVADSNAEATSD